MFSRTDCLLICLVFYTILLPIFTFFFSHLPALVSVLSLTSSHHPQATFGESERPHSTYAEKKILSTWFLVEIVPKSTLVRLAGCPRPGLMNTSQRSSTHGLRSLQYMNTSRSRGLPSSHSPRRGNQSPPTGTRVMAHQEAGTLSSFVVFTVT